MTRQMVATKVHLPAVRRRLVERQRLSRLLGLEARLTLVSAPAGFGKTTLLAEWLRPTPADRRAVAWLSLDSADNDPATFWSYLIAALGTVLPGIEAGLAELLDSSSMPTDLVAIGIVNELAAAPDDVWLVLDDYHLIDHPDVRDGVAFLVEHLPSIAHVVISTRADPNLPLSRWRGRGELVEIRSADLRFTPDEASAYLNEVTGLHLSAQHVETLQHRTEGWVAALQLAALSLQRRDDAGDFIARFAGDDRYIVDYLIDEVLALQPQQTRDFLVQTAVLDRFTGPLCDAVTGGHDGIATLSLLERSNMFLVALDDRRQWFRYHQLFADVLRAHLLTEQPELVPLLHRRASDWFTEHGLTAEAIRHALAADDDEHAARLMETATAAIRRSRQEPLLIGWLEALPDRVIAGSPVLSVFRGYMDLVSGDLDAFQARLDHAERLLASVPDGTSPRWADCAELHTLPATIAIYRASLAQARGDLSGTVDQARLALSLAGPQDHLARAGAAGFLGLAAWAAGDVGAALEIFPETVTSLLAAGHVVDALTGTVPMADMWLAAGRPGKARRLYEHAIQQARTRGRSVASATAELYIGLSEIAVEADDLGTASEHLAQAAALADPSAMRSESRYRWYTAMGRLTQAGGRPAAAVDLFDQAAGWYRPGFFPEVRPISAMRARAWIQQGELALAADWARERSTGTEVAGYLSEFSNLTVVRLLLAQHRAGLEPDALDRAAAILKRLGREADMAGRAGSLIEIRVLQALTLQALGDHVRAVEGLIAACELAPEPAGYVRLFLDEGAPMVTLLRQAGSATGHPHLRHLLAHSADAESPASADPTHQVAGPDALSEREIEVMRLLAGELSGPQIARELFVSQNTLRTHTKHIFTKLGVTNRRAAVRRARERGVI